MPKIMPDTRVKWLIWHWNFPKRTCTDFQPCKISIHHDKDRQEALTPFFKIHFERTLSLPVFRKWQMRSKVFEHYHFEKSKSYARFLSQSYWLSQSFCFCIHDHVSSRDWWFPSDSRPCKYMRSLYWRPPQFNQVIIAKFSRLLKSWFLASKRSKEASKTDSASGEL
jgi:hypothetical protein